MLYFRTCSFLTSTSISTRTPFFSEILVSFLTLTSLFQHQPLFGYIHLSFHIYSALSIHLPFFTWTKKKKTLFQYMHSSIHVHPLLYLRLRSRHAFCLLFSRHNFLHGLRVLHHFLELRVANYRGCQSVSKVSYVVASIGRLLNIIGLFCKRALWKRRYSAKETYNFKEPTNHSHPICRQAIGSIYRQLIYIFIAL